MSDKAKTSKRVATEASEILRKPEYRAKPKSVGDRPSRRHPIRSVNRSAITTADDEARPDRMARLLRMFA